MVVRMETTTFKNPFVQKIRLLTHLLVVSAAVNIAFGATLFYSFAIKDSQVFSHSPLPEVTIRKEHSALLQSFFQMSFEELVGELSSKVEISDGYRICDLALAILATYHYLDLERALMGEALEEREVMFIHTDGGEQFPLCLYPDVKEYHYSLIKGFIQENKYPFTAEGIFADLKIKKEHAPTDLVSAFMLSKEYLAIYTFVSRFFEELPREKLVLLLMDGGFQDVERFYYLYLENMHKPKEMLRYFFQTYTKLESKHAAEMWLAVDEEHILRQLSNEELMQVCKLTDNQNFLQKVNESVRGSEVRALAEEKLPAVEKEVPEEKRSEFTEYVVQSGDSIWKIAHRHKISMKNLKAYNKLSSDILRPGQKLQIPKK